MPWESKKDITSVAIKKDIHKEARLIAKRLRLPIGYVANCMIQTGCFRVKNKTSDLEDFMVRNWIEMYSPRPSQAESEPKTTEPKPAESSPIVVECPAIHQQIACKPNARTKTDAQNSA